MKKILSLVLVCVTMLALVCVVSFANAAQIGESSTSWELVDGVLTVTGTGAMPDYRGVEDSRPWLSELSTITKVVVKSGVTHVGSSSFTGATGITEVVLEEGVETVGMDAFCACGTIDKVTLPASLTALSQGVFFNSSIKEIDYAKTYAEFKANVSVGSYNDAVDAADWGEEVATSGTLTATMSWSFADGTLTISGTGEMPNWEANSTPWVALNAQITKVELSEGITTIGKNAFARTKIVEIVIPEGVTSIGSDAFAYVSTLKKVTFPASLSSLGQGTVYGSNNIEEVHYYGDSKTAFENISSKAPYNTNYTKDGVSFYAYGLGITPYGCGWENWSGQTQLLVIAGLTPDATTKAYTWNFTLSDGTTTETFSLKSSSQYDYGNGNAIWRFEPCKANGENRFYPVAGKSYSVKAEVYNGSDRIYVTHTTSTWTVPADFEYIFPTLSVTPYSNGWETWSGQTQLLITAPIVPDAASESYVWEITLNDGTDSYTFEIVSSSNYNFGNGSAIWRFQPCVNDTFNRFIPKPGAVYTLSANVYYNDELYFTVSGGENKWTVPADYTPVVPEFAAEVDGYYFENLQEAIWYAESEAVVNGKINKDDVNTVVVFAEGTHSIFTNTVVAVVAAGDNINFTPYNGRKLLEKEVEVDGDTYTAYVYAHKDYAVAAVGEDVYTSVGAAVAAAEATTIEGVKNNPVVIFQEGNVTVNTDKMVAVVLYDDYSTSIVYDGNKYVAVEETVEYEGDTYTAYVIINTETFAQAMVGDTFYATVEEAIAAAEASTIEGVKNNPVIVLKSGVVAINTTKAVAVVALDEVRTTFVFDENKYFTYEVEVEYEGDTRTAYAVLNAVDFCQAIVGDTMYADIADAIAAAKGTFTPVIVFKPGVVNVEVDSFVLLGAVDSTVTTINPNGNLSYETEVEYEGDTYTAYAVYNHNYIFANVADKITAAIPQANATYVDGALNIALSTTDLTTLVGTDVFEEIVAELAPLFILSEDASICGVTLYENDQLIVSNVFKAFNALGLDLEAIANLGTKELTSFDIAITGATTNVVVPVSITLDITDAQFESLKTNAAKADKYVDYTISDNGEIVLVVDARPVVDIVMEKELVNGKTIKEIREFINGTSLKELADKLEGYGLTGAKGEAVKVFCKLIDKIATTKYAANLDSTLAAFDSNNDGVYVVNKTFTVSFGEKVNQIVDQFKEKNPEIADYIEIENIVDVDSLTISVDATVTVFDKYTVTFVDVNGNEIYTETLLEGEIPSYVGVLPEKEATAEYVYVFFGWTDGETTFDGELAELTKNVTYKPVFEEVAVDGVDEDLIFAFGSVTFQDSFAINMGVNKAVLEGYTSWYVVATLADGSEETLYGTENGSYIKFTLNSISAKEVSDVTSFVIYAEKEVNGVVVTAHGNAKEYCIKQYAMNKICCENASDELKTLCVDTLVYAAYAQIKFGYNTANLATKDLTADDFALGTQGAPVLENAFSYENTESELVHFHQATLVYESNIAIKFYLNLKEYSPEDVYVKVVYDDGASELVISGEELVANGNFYTFEFSEYSAAELRREVVATVYDANTDAVVSGPLTYGAEVYAYRQVAAGKDVDLVNAMMNYAISAEAVFNA